jgi:hypothetical protein
LDALAALPWDVLILAAPDHQQLATKFPNSVERVVLPILTEAALLAIGGAEAGTRRDIGIEGGTEGKTVADTDPDRPELARARGVDERKSRTRA